MRTTKENKTNMSTPEHPMTESEFLSFIKEGEKGHLYLQVRSKRNLMIGEVN